jgi:hypothetical protein
MVSKLWGVPPRKSLGVALSAATPRPVASSFLLAIGLAGFPLRSLTRHPLAEDHQSPNFGISPWIPFTFPC